MSANKFAKSDLVHSRILVPQRYYRQPVISRLVSRYGLTVNITAASLGLGSSSDGWFDLELLGNPQQLTDSLSYLQGLGVNLLQMAIANHIQPKQHNLSFPNPVGGNYQPNPTIPTKSGWRTTQLQAEFQQWVSQGQSNRLRLQLCILKTYSQKPIISQLVSRYGLTVNITSALLQPDMQDDGWFDLDLWGRTKQLNSSLNYLEKLGLPIWLDCSSILGDRPSSPEKFL